MRYRDRLTHEIISGQEVRERASSRRLPGPVVKVRKSSKGPVQTIIGIVFLAADEAKWSDFEFNLALVDPIIDQPPPEHNDFTQSLREVEPVEVDGEFLQAWEIDERFESIKDLRGALIRKVRGICSVKLDDGIVVDKMRVKIDARGLARLAIAVIAYGKKETGIKVKFVVEDKVFDIDTTVLGTMAERANAHIQSCYARLAQLIQKIKKSSDPMSINLETGWPDV